MDFDPIEAVLQPAIPRDGRQNAGVVGRRRSNRLGGEPSGGGRLAHRHAAGGAVAAFDLQLPDRLQAGRGVDAAQRDVEQGGILDIGDLALPDVEVGDGVTAGQRRRSRIEGLVEVGGGVLGEGLDQQAVDVEAAGLDRQIERRAGDQPQQEGVRRGQIRRAHRAEIVERQEADAPAQDVDFLVPVRIELGTPLLHQHARVALAPVEAEPCVVAGHGVLPSRDAVVVTSRR